MITAEAIVGIAPAAAPYAVELAKQMAEAGIQANPRRAASFLGQVHVESGGFRQVVESLNYRAERLKAMFGRHRISLADCDRFGRTKDHPADQVALANLLYGGEWGRRNLGNTEPGDGWRFRGRGLKQLTGRDNYRRCSRAWLGDETLLLHPERLSQPDGAVASAVWFWASRELNAVADRGSVQDVTRVVNGGQIGLQDRIHWTRQYHVAWVEPADFSNVVAHVVTLPQGR